MTEFILNVAVEAVVNVEADTVEAARARVDELLTGGAYLTMGKPGEGSLEGHVFLVRDQRGRPQITIIREKA